MESDRHMVRGAGLPAARLGLAASMQCRCLQQHRYQEVMCASGHPLSSRHLLLDQTKQFFISIRMIKQKVTFHSNEQVKPVCVTQSLIRKVKSWPDCPGIQFLLNRLKIPEF